MSYLDRIRECNGADMSRFRPFRVADQRVGWIKAPFAEALAAHPRVFRVSAEAVELAPRLDTPEKRTAAVDEVLRALHAEGVIPHWRDEPYPVSVGWGQPVLFLMERSAVAHLGVRAYGVHMNGVVRDGDGMQMWVAKRAVDKPTFPGMWDNMVAGGQPAGIGLLDNLIKECREEADIPDFLARLARPVGAISYTLETPLGLKPDVMFVYDLELPSAFAPRNTDGEVDEFSLWPIERVMETVAETAEFKYNCNLVIIHFLIRHGLIDPEAPDYLAIANGLLDHRSV